MSVSTIANTQKMLNITSRGKPRCLEVGGFTPITTIDYPDHLACVVYTQGCSLRCKYCQNKELIPFAGTQKVIHWIEIESYLKKRLGMLEAVVFSGGEPTLQPGLGEAISSATAMGFKVGLHTAGVSVAALRKVLPKLSWVGLDVKALKADYEYITGRRLQWGQNQSSLALLLASNIGFECRTTVDWRLTTPEKLLSLAQLLSDQGVEQYAVQVNHGIQCLDSELQTKPYLDNERQLILKEKLASLFPRFRWRE